MLDVQGLDLHYGNSQILYNVSTTATAGEVTAILGTTPKCLGPFRWMSQLRPR